ncbi:hypothetical protein DUI87_28504 [Hirundo rustica rustica]|uniref:Uncharacterized protein n=1 Tax=Hirundo rustica rustica TaxID=333673 RepID=A0A3M0J2R7_HIRRU|nr:hypothetical protein DUI87_28504 [Hirundo rustica rustica]
MGGTKAPAAIWVSQREDAPLNHTLICSQLIQVTRNNQIIKIQEAQGIQDHSVWSVSKPDSSTKSTPVQQVMEFLDKGNALDTISGGCEGAFDTVSHRELISDAEENEDYRRAKRRGRNPIKTRKELVQSRHPKPPKESTATKKCNGEKPRSSFQSSFQLLQDMNHVNRIAAAVVLLMNQLQAEEPVRIPVCSAGLILTQDSCGSAAWLAENILGGHLASSLLPVGASSFEIPNYLSEVIAKIILQSWRDLQNLLVYESKRFRRVIRAQQGEEKRREEKRREEKRREEKRREEKRREEKRRREERREEEKRREEKRREEKRREEREDSLPSLMSFSLLLETQARHI